MRRTNSWKDFAEIKTIPLTSRSEVIMSFKDRTFCASKNCKNKCGRKMTSNEKQELAKLGIEGVKLSLLVTYEYFCEEPSYEEK